MKIVLELWQSLREPRQAILGDNLSQVIHEWKTNGEHIVLMMDANEDVHTGKIHEFLEETDGDVVMAMHVSDAANSTHIVGLKPIDGILATPSC
jgi:hypothetical protein